jgi:hypothetical protein
LSNQAFLLTTVHPGSGDKIADDTKPKNGHILLLLLFHGKTSFELFKFSLEIA